MLLDIYSRIFTCVYSTKKTTLIKNCGHMKASRRHVYFFTYLVFLLIAHRLKVVDNLVDSLIRNEIDILMLVYL